MKKQTRTFSRERTAAAEARRFAVEAAGEIPGYFLQTIELMVSELATNCIRHAGTCFELTVCKTPGEVRVEATDHAGGEPAIRSAGVTDLSGRGLRIVEMLADDWGVRRAVGRGKTVWFTLSIPSAEDQLARPEDASAKQRGQRSPAQRAQGAVKSDAAGAHRRTIYRVHLPHARRLSPAARSSRPRAPSVVCAYVASM
jgi:anti-sigma regulatory factor (Ser/Thr protein kinase)